jgi:hypothetical protein
MKKIDAFAKFRGRKVRRGGDRGLYGWRRNDRYLTDAPPQYPGGPETYGYLGDEKSMPAHQKTDGFFSPVVLPPLAIPETAATLSRADSQRQNQVREVLSDNQMPYGYTTSPQQGTVSATQAFYNSSPSTTVSPLTPNPQQGSLSATQAFYNTNPQTHQNDLLTRQISDANQTMRSQNTFVSAQTSNLNDSNQREVGRVSYLSSLSSGFGDGLIIPEATNPNSRQTYRQSQNPNGARFSWARSQGQRDTVYTTTSEESAPRFRTVTSWVAQQTGRVEKQKQVDNEIPNVPALPPMPLQAGLNHQRDISEDPIFKFHPGEEIQISRGSRVPSEILNKKTGIN